MSLNSCEIYRLSERVVGLLPDDPVSKQYKAALDIGIEWTQNHGSPNGLVEVVDSIVGAAALTKLAHEGTDPAGWSVGEYIYSEEDENSNVQVRLQKDGQEKVVTLLFDREEEALTLSKFDNKTIYGALEMGNYARQVHQPIFDEIGALIKGSASRQEVSAKAEDLAYGLRFAAACNNQGQSYSQDRQDKDELLAKDWIQQKGADPQVFRQGWVLGHLARSMALKAFNTALPDMESMIGILNDVRSGWPEQQITGLSCLAEVMDTVMYRRGDYVWNEQHQAYVK